ncbi:MAG: outer membrane beta-barrel protein [Bacteroidales bacterium]|nr:outer membrane beta-barrel protein [Bacteroidales bacterium]
MDRKVAFLVCLLAIFGIKLSAQENISYGIYVGGNINTMNISNSLYYDDSEVNTVPNIVNHDTVSYSVSYLPVYDASVKFTGGFAIGGFVEYELGDNLGLQMELLYNQYGYKLNGKVDKKNYSDDDFVTYGYTGKMKMSNISAAILLKYRAIENRMSVDFGIQPSYCFRAIKEIERGIVHKDVVYNSNDEFNPLNFCITGGITGYFFDNIVVSARYILGLTDVLKAKQPYIFDDDPYKIRYRYSSAQSKTSSIQITLGYKIQ